jgi:hypothetical protein
MGVQGWTEVLVGDRIHALAARGLRAEVLAGRVMVLDDEAQNRPARSRGGRAYPSRAGQARAVNFAVLEFVM